MFLKTFNNKDIQTIKDLFPMSDWSVCSTMKQEASLESETRLAFPVTFQASSANIVEQNLS